MTFLTFFSTTFFVKNFDILLVTEQLCSVCLKKGLRALVGRFSRKSWKNKCSSGGNFIVFIISTKWQRLRQSLLNSGVNLQGYVKEARNAEGSLTTSAGRNQNISTHLFSFSFLLWLQRISERYPSSTRSEAATREMSYKCIMTLLNVLRSCNLFINVNEACCESAVQPCAVYSLCSRPSQLKH